MPRELVAELIKRKKAIHQATHDLEMAWLDVEEKLLWCTPEQESGFDSQLREIKAKQLASKAQLDRAYFFSHRYSHDAVPTLCASCFVERGESNLMTEDPARHRNGEMHFRCGTCGAELRVAEITDSP